VSSALAKTLNLGQEPGVAAPRTCSRSMVARGWVMAAEQQVPHRRFAPIRNDKGLGLPAEPGMVLRARQCGRAKYSFDCDCRLVKSIFYRGRWCAGERTAGSLRLRSGQALTAASRRFGMTRSCGGCRALLLPARRPRNVSGCGYENPTQRAMLGGICTSAYG
jgi:hypothetical protein